MQNFIVFDALDNFIGHFKAIDVHEAYQKFREYPLGSKLCSPIDITDAITIFVKEANND